MKRLSYRQQRFVAEYVKDQNAGPACIRAGYTKHASRRVGCALLKNLAIKDAIQKRLKRINDKCEVTAEKVVRELWRVGNANIAGLFNENGGFRSLSEMTEDQQHIIAAIDEDELFEGLGHDRKKVGVTKKVRLWDKVRALEILARKFKLLTDKMEHSFDADAWELLDRFNAAAKKAKE